MLIICLSLYLCIFWCSLSPGLVGASDLKVDVKEEGKEEVKDDVKEEVKENLPSVELPEKPSALKQGEVKEEVLGNYV